MGVGVNEPRHNERVACVNTALRGIRLLNCGTISYSLDAIRLRDYCPVFDDSSLGVHRDDVSCGDE